MSNKNFNRDRRRPRMRGWDNYLDRLDNPSKNLNQNINSLNHQGFKRKQFGGAQISCQRAHQFLEERKKSGGTDRAKFRNGTYSFKRNLLPAYSNWFQIKIKHGQMYQKDYIVQTLQNYLQQTELIPITYAVDDQSASFIVDDHFVAERLLSLSGKIMLNDGHMLSIEAQAYTNYIKADEPQFLDALKTAMNSRYNPSFKMLNLSKFYLDPHLLNENIFCPLDRGNILYQVADLIAKFIPDVVALDLSENKLKHLTRMRHVFQNLKSIKALNLSKNRLNSISILDSIKGMNLEQINLSGNPLCSEFKDDEYIRNVKKRFPQISILDDVNVNLESGLKIPPEKPSFMIDPHNGIEFSKAFLEQYYSLCEAEDRSGLFAAYSENATFSMDVILSGNMETDQELSKYVTVSRNLIKGKLEIVKVLNELPQVQHDRTSFKVDLLIFTKDLIQLNVCGLFKEVVGNERLKYFSRVFLLVPLGTGFIINNDQLTISPASRDQLRIARANEMQANEMVAQLASQSGMNIRWARKCLSETQWDYNNALASFTRLNEEGRIPEEAFFL